MDKKFGWYLLRVKNQFVYVHGENVFKYDTKLMLPNFLKTWVELN